MRLRRVLGMGLLAATLALGAIGGAQAQVPPDLPDTTPEIPQVTVPAPPPEAAPLVGAVAPAGTAVCEGAYTALATIGLLSVLTPGLPVAPPVIPGVGLYTAVGMVQAAVRPPLDGLCAFFE